MLGGIFRHLPEIREDAGGQQVGADKVRRIVAGALLVAAADVTVLLAGFVLIPLLVHHIYGCVTNDNLAKGIECVLDMHFVGFIFGHGNSPSLIIVRGGSTPCCRPMAVHSIEITDFPRQQA